MILHHVSVGVRDVEAAGRFYDAVLGALGYQRYWQSMPYAIAYGEDGYDFWVQLPYDQNPAGVGNGQHVAFNARSIAAVHAFHKAALDHGGSDEGEPGPRPDYGADYYGCFVRDPDGNKIEAVLKPERIARVKLPEAKTKAKAKAKKATAKKETAKKAGTKKAVQKAAKTMAKKSTKTATKNAKKKARKR